MADPTLHRGIKILPMQQAHRVGRGKFTQPADEAPAIVIAQLAVIGKNPISKEIEAAANRNDVGLIRV